MAGLQRSAQTFRRSGSSGLVWDERFLNDGAAEDGGPRKGPRPELRHSRSVGSGTGVLLRRRGRDEAEEDDDKRRKLVLAKPKEKDDHRKQQEAPGRKAFRTRDVAPAADPPSPRVSGCCAIFRAAGGSSARRARPRKR